MKVLFLDVDGVLNCGWRWAGGKAENLDPICLSLLWDIVQKTGCKIVVSSTWRMFGDDCGGLMQVLDKRGIEVIGKTSVLDTPRHKEIAKWIKENKPDRFAIVDDDSDAGVGFESNFFETTFSEGLTQDIADRIIIHLF